MAESESAFYAEVEQVLLETEPGAKCEAVQALELQADSWSTGARFVCDEFIQPGLPPTLILVHPRHLPRRGLGTDAGRAALVHAVAHIEFNAINLALDAIWRFRGLPRAYIDDWLSVAKDEARHFGWLSGRLKGLGHAYGDFPAHNGLWEAACKTSSDPLMRMALVPRVLEARGLDVTPAMISRLRAAGDDETADILVNILDEEVAHVAIGTRWFHFLCKERGLLPDDTFQRLLEEHMQPIARAVLNLQARRASGFSEAEIAYLQRAQA